MWTPLRQEVEKVREELGLIDSFHPVALDKWRRIEENIYSTFVVTNAYRSRPLWIWEKLKVEHAGYDADTPYLVLRELVDARADVFLLLNETVNERDKFWIYEAKIESALQIVEELTGIDEVTIVDKKYKWIICITHHDSLVVGGRDLLQRLDQLRPKHDRK